MYASFEEDFSIELSLSVAEKLIFARQKTARSIPLSVSRLALVFVQRLFLCRLAILLHSLYQTTIFCVFSLQSIVQLIPFEYCFAYSFLVQFPLSQHNRNIFGSRMPIAKVSRASLCFFEDFETLIYFSHGRSVFLRVYFLKQLFP